MQRLFGRLELNRPRRPGIHHAGAGSQLRLEHPAFRTQNVLNGIYGADMTNTDHPWEPPMAGTEAAHLTGALDRLRTTFRFKADDLDAAGLRVRIGASSLTLGGLLKHLAVCEDNMFTIRLSGAPIGAPWEGTDWDGEMRHET